MTPPTGYAGRARRRPGTGASRSSAASSASSIPSKAIAVRPRSVPGRSAAVAAPGAVGDPPGERGHAIQRGEGDTTQISSSPMSTNVPAPATARSDRAKPRCDRSRVACEVSTSAGYQEGRGEHAPVLLHRRACPTRAGRPRAGGRARGAGQGRAYTAEPPPDQRRDALAGQPVGKLLLGKPLIRQQLGVADPVRQPVPKVGAQPIAENGVDYQPEATSTTGAGRARQHHPSA